MSGYSDAVLADSPLLYVRFEETSGATCANSGSLGGNAIATNAFTRNTTSGYPGLGVALTLSTAGADGYASYPDNAALDITGDVTYECWIKMPSVSAANSYLMAKGYDNTLPDGGYAIYVQFNGSVQVWRAGVGQIGSVATATAAIADNTWYHVAFTRSGNTYTIYINGASAHSSSSSQVIVANTADFFVGVSGHSGATWNGDIDEVAVYSTALSAARIAAHYAAKDGGGTTYTKASYAGLGLISGGESATIYTETRYATVGLVSGGVKTVVVGATYVKTAYAVTGLIGRGAKVRVGAAVIYIKTSYAMVGGAASGRAVKPTVSAGMPPATIHVFTLTPNPADMFALTPHPVAPS